jgi:hypothetical protein
MHNHGSNMYSGTNGIIYDLKLSWQQNAIKSSILMQLVAREDFIEWCNVYQYLKPQISHMYHQM